LGVVTYKVFKASKVFVNLVGRKAFAFLCFELRGTTVLDNFIHEVTIRDHFEKSTEFEYQNPLALKGEISHKL